MCNCYVLYLIRAMTKNHEIRITSGQLLKYDSVISRADSLYPCNLVGPRDIHRAPLRAKCARKELMQKLAKNSDKSPIKIPLSAKLYFVSRR